MQLVVDANELFAALISQGKTLNLFFDSGLELASPEFILNEFRKHKAELAEKAGLSERDILSFMLLLIPQIKFFETEEFKEFLEKAVGISSDPNDAEYLALALKLGCPLWSEDKKLKGQSCVQVFNTRELLELLEKGR
jgi:predicted nucleic acid-binding protein